MHELIEKREPKEEKPMKIIKRNGAEVVFDIDKIIMAVTKANDAVDEKVRMTPLQIERISQSVQIACEEIYHLPLYPQPSASVQHHGRPHPQPDRVQ